MRRMSRAEIRQQRLVRTLVAGCGNSAHVLELCYWSREWE
jgi:hypothetical protein